MLGVARYLRYTWVSGFLSSPLLHNHKETCAGCMVSRTTLSNWLKSTSLRNDALNASTDNCSVLASSGKIS
jgi:hypothetical protein